MRLNSFLLLAILPFSSAMAATDASSPDVHGVQQEIAAIQLDRALNLTHAQAVTLLPILKDAASKAAAQKAAFESAKPQLLTALTQARDELRSSGTISDATKQALAAAHPAPQPGTMAAMKDLRAKIDQVLTPAQQQALQTTQLGVWPAMPQQACPMGMGAGMDACPGMGAGMEACPGMGAGMGPGMGPGAHHKGKGMGMHRAGKGFFGWRTLLSDPFLKLLQTRAA
jgi:hypothetical protein